MTRTWMHGAIVVLMTLAVTKTLVSQTVARDSSSGDYTVTYVALDGVTYAVIVTARDKVDPAFEVEIEQQTTALLYRYSLTHRSTPQAQQPIKSVDVACPLADAALVTTAPTPWTAGRNDGVPSRLGCFFRLSGGSLPPGATVVGLQLTSTWLPAVRVSRVRGLAEVTGFESGDDTPAAVGRLVQELQLAGDSGSWFGLPAVVPARPPAALADPGPGLDSVVADLAQACSLAWISNGSACTSLGVQLSQSRDAVTAGNSSGARTSLEGFLAQLGAQHGPGLPVNDNAYWLLKVNAEFILGRLGQPTTPMCFGLAATIYVQNGVIVGGPDNGQAYTGDLDGTSGNDVIVGTDARDIIEAGSGADKVCGLGGDDLIKGQVDADQLDGGDGNDAIEGGAGNDVIMGGGGNDLLKGQDGNDTIGGGEGNDTIEGGPGDDDLDGGPGTDTLKGQGGTDACRQGETVETCETS